MTEDCIAMSEDGSWAAYSKSMKRGQVFSHIARSSDIHGLDFWELTHHYKVRAGFVHQDTEGPLYAGFGTTAWYECEADHPKAERVWIVTRC